MTTKDIIDIENHFDFDEDGNKIFYAHQVEEMLITFAKYHVKKAIEECIEEASSGSSTDTVSYEDVEKALQNCYTLTNTK